MTKKEKKRDYDKVRALLCGACNTSLGHYEKNKHLFEKYLNTYDNCTS